jgi:hypothetical protein
MSSNASYRANHIRSINHLCNTKCVWSILLWMEAPQQGRQGHTHQVSCYYFCSYIILKDNQKRLTWLVCGSPYNYHSVLSPATYLLNPSSTYGLGPKLAVSSVVYTRRVYRQTLKMTSSLQFHCAHVRDPRSDRVLTDRMWYKQISWLTLNQPPLVVAPANLCLTRTLHLTEAKCRAL